MASITFGELRDLFLGIEDRLESKFGADYENLPVFLNDIPHEKDINVELWIRNYLGHWYVLMAIDEE